MPTNQVAVGVFQENEQAHCAILALKGAGFVDEQIGLAVRDEHAASDLAHKMEEETHAGEGAALGVAAGAGVGVAWALGVATGLLPAIGPVIAGGILASLLASTATGAAAGGLVGALIGLGIPEEHAKRYEEHFHEGRVIVTVDVGDRFDEASSLLAGCGALSEEEVHEALPL
jgi:hypothetical protein